VRILAVTNKYPPDAIGGAERLAASLCETLTMQGHAVTVLTTQPGGDTQPARAPQRGVDVCRIRSWCAFIPRPGTPRAKSLCMQAYAHLLDLYNPCAARGLRALIADVRPDVLHTHNLYGLSTCAWNIAAARGIRVVHTAHDAWLLCPKGTLLHADGTPCTPTAGDGDGANEGVRGRADCRACGLYRRLYLAQVRHIDVLCCPSAHQLALHRRLGSQAREHRLVPNGIPVPPPPDYAVRPPDDVLRVCYLGAIETHKGVGTLLAAAECLRSAPIAFEVAGAGSRADALAVRYNHLPKVTWTGVIGAGEKSAWLRRHDVLVFPSISAESFGLSVVEAQAHGLAVVVSDLGGQRELVADGQTGLLFPPGDADALADRLLTLAADRDRLSAMRLRASAAAARFSLERMTAAYLAAYEGPPPPKLARRSLNRALKVPTQACSRAGWRRWASNPD
jgi:glycosyltransferase involved in cell wall biosynthesis